ncbi:type VI secretion system tube protein Hcp [Serratia marcescens]|nr:type VI secretion system tube protein Hcp [Serratia marcescens]
MKVNMYLHVAGVTGESTDAEHPQWIDVQSFYWCASQGGNTGIGERVGRAVFNDLIVRIVLDKAAPALLRFCASARHVNEVELSLCTINQDVVECSRIVLEDVLVSKIDFVKETRNDAVYVTCGFRAAAVRHHYWSPMLQGVRGAESVAGWDIRQNKAL